MDQFLTVLAGLILQAQVGATDVTAAPLVRTHVNGSVALLAFDKTEFKGTSLRRKHVAIAVSDLGDIVGAVLNKRGASLCEIRGFFDGQCVVLRGCGADGAAC
jgi:hypothetical protein